MTRLVLRIWLFAVILLCFFLFILSLTNPPLANPSVKGPTEWLQLSSLLLLGTIPAASIILCMMVIIKPFSVSPRYKFIFLMLIYLSIVRIYSPLLTPVAEAYEMPVEEPFNWRDFLAVFLAGFLPSIISYRKFIRFFSK